jgi:hypothetical protein
VLEDLFLDNVWIAVGAWAVLYVGDYALTIVGARLHRRHANEHIVFSRGYELNPVFERDVSRLRIVSPRFVVILVATSGLLYLIGYMSRSIPEMFVFVLGALLLVEVAIHIRHVKNIVLFRSLAREGAVEGRISYARWLSYRVSATEMLAFAVLYVLSYFLSASLFFLGGATTCLLVALKHIVLAARERSRSKG